MVRIFTVAEELPFAGHPTLGTASVVAHARQVTEVALDLKVGKFRSVSKPRRTGSLAR